MTPHFSAPEIPLTHSVMMKILVIGDYGVGKTAIIRRYSKGKFSSNYKITIGAECLIRNYVYRQKTNVTVQLWDISGQERFNCMTRVYYKNACAAIVVFDLSRISTFNSVYKWLCNIRDKVNVNDGINVPVVIFANKSDIAGYNTPNDSLDGLCRDNNVIGWYKTSAKNNVNIDNAMDHLISSTMDEMKKQRNNYDHISLHRRSGKNLSLCC